MDEIFKFYRPALFIRVYMFVWQRGARVWMSGSKVCLPNSLLVDHVNAYNLP